MKYASFDSNGHPTGFYMPEILGPPFNEDGTPNPAYPENFIEISNAAWVELTAFPGQRRWDGQRVVSAAPQPVSAGLVGPISRRQFAQALAEPGTEFQSITWEEAEKFSAGTEIPGALAVAINAIPDPAERSRTRMFLLSAGQLERTHPKTEELGTTLGWAPTKLTRLWQYASTL